MRTGARCRRRRGGSCADPWRRDRHDGDREALVEEHRDQRQDGQALAPAGI